MKKSARAVSMALGGIMTLQLAGCYGNFALTRKLYTWNGGVGDKWINSVVMWGMMIIPVYPLAGFADFAILNTIQFWTGQNPVAMQEGEKDIQKVAWHGKEFQLTATANRLDVQELVEGKLQAPVSLIYDAGTKSWTATSATDQKQIIQMVGESGQVADLIYPDGHRQRVDLSLN